MIGRDIDVHIRAIATVLALLLLPLSGATHDGMCEARLSGSFHSQYCVDFTSLDIVTYVPQDRPSLP